MNEKIKNAVQEYQCSGCTNGSDFKCYSRNSIYEVSCGDQYSDISIMINSEVFLGMPTSGFDFFGAIHPCFRYRIDIFKTYQDLVNGCKYGKFNVPVWKHLNSLGHTIVRGILPKLNQPFVDVILENCIDKVDCLEFTNEDIEGMD